MVNLVRTVANRAPIFTDVVTEMSKDAEGQGFHKLPDIPFGCE